MVDSRIFESKENNNPIPLPNLERLKNISDFHIEVQLLNDKLCNTLRN